MAVYNFSSAIVRAPGRSVIEGLRGVDRGAPSFESVEAEHAAYVRALEAAGVAVEVLPPLELYPDSIFVEDAALVFTGAAIVLRPGARSRQGEAAEIAPALQRRFNRVMRLKAGTVDGGDVLTTAREVFIGLSDRTTIDGARALTGLLNDIGLHARAVSTPKGVLHFKSDCSLLDEDTILATRRLAVTGVFDGLRVMQTPAGEEGAANAVRVNDRVLLSAGYPRTADMLNDAGYNVALLETGEVAKIDAGLSCLSLRWKAG